MANKQKKWLNNVFDADDSNISSIRTTKKPGTKRKQTPTKSTSVESKASISNQKFSSNWIENFTPQTIEDLAIHPKKLEEIQEWFRIYKKSKKENSSPILLLTGPPGSGKTAAIRTIGKTLEYAINEWVTPVDQEFYRNIEDVDCYNDTNVYKESQADQFAEFLFRSSRYCSVFDSFKKRIVLIEDFPNGFLSNTAAFADVLEQYKSYGKAPLIFIVSDTKSKKFDICQTLFPDSIREKYQIAKISFNAASTTLLKKALKLVCTAMANEKLTQQFNLPTSDQIDSIILTSNGDIRNAVINLYFSSLKGSTSLQTEQVQQSSSTSATSKRKNFQKKFKSIGCESSITLMHALGRVFNPKCIKNTESKRFIHSPETLSDDFLSQPSTFVNLIHANHLCHFQTIDNALMAGDVLSQFDVYSNEWRDDNLMKLSLNMAIRGMMVYNDLPTIGWSSIKGARKVNSDECVKMPNVEITGQLTRKNFVSDVNTYLNIILRA